MANMALSIQNSILSVRTSVVMMKNRAFGDLVKIKKTVNDVWYFFGLNFTIVYS